MSAKQSSADPPVVPHRWGIFFLALLMLSSGFAGLAYEVLYGRILGNIIGDQFAISAAVLITFLLGIGLGSLHAYRLWRFLWLVELCIGLYALVFTINSAALDSFLYDYLPQVFGGLEWSIAISVLLLVIPAFLIGCSLPLFAGYLAQVAQKHAFARAYAFYNFGAALTIIAIEFLLLRHFGLQSTVVLIASVNILIAFGALYWLRRLPQITPQRKWGASGYSHRVVAALLAAGMASAVFQLFMVKFSELFLGPFRETFALTLSIILLGIALGSWLVKLLSWRFEQVLLASLAGVLMVLLIVNPVTETYARLYADFNTGYWSGVGLKWLALFAVMGVAASAFGATIPALVADNKTVTEDSGFLLFVASMGNVAGFLLMVFVLHQQFDYGIQLLAVVGLVLLALTLYRPMLLRRTLVLLLAGSTGVAVHAMAWDEELLYISYPQFRDVERLHQTRINTQLPERFRGYQDVFSINRINGRPVFFINGYVSIPLDSPSEILVGTLSSFYSPRLDKALVLGLGSGATASAVGQFFAHTDAVEINPVVRDNLYRMKEWNFDIEQNPHVNIIVDDAIHYTKATDKRYSLILNTVTTPLYFSSSKLYTHEFFEVIRDRLAPGGIYVTWLDGRINDEGVDIILNTLQQSFAHCATAYVKASYLLLLCSEDRLQLQPQALTHIPEKLSDYFWSKGIAPDLIRYQLLTSDSFSLIGDSQLPLNRLDYPSLEFEMARLGAKGIRGFLHRLREHLNTDDIATVMGPEHFNSAELLLHTELTLDNDPLTRRWSELIDQQDPAFLQAYMPAGDRFHETSLSYSDCPHVRSSYATFLAKTKRFSEAADILRELLSKVPDYPSANHLLALSYERLGEFELASDHYRRQLEFTPEDSSAMYRLSRLAYRQGDMPQAIDLLRESIRIKPDAKRYFQLARLLQHQDDDAGAHRAWQQGLQLGSPPPRDNGEQGRYNAH